jgi:hypothetical protein
MQHPSQFILKPNRRGNLSQAQVRERHGTVPLSNAGQTYQDEKIYGRPWVIRCRNSEERTADALDA